MVTAIEPVMQACGGMWIANGSGDADKLVVDRLDKIQVPPDEPKYTLKRVWLTEEEETGYYYGFSNEGLWPLCHIAHNRPIFRQEDWEEYVKVNQKFADAVLAEIKNQDRPIILIQDFHLSLVPRMIKAQRPGAAIGIFWHIPWPNPESFSICPWKKEILDGKYDKEIKEGKTEPSEEKKKELETYFEKIKKDQDAKIKLAKEQADAKEVKDDAKTKKAIEDVKKK